MSWLFRRRLWIFDKFAADKAWREYVTEKWDQVGVARKGYQVEYPVAYTASKYVARELYKYLKRHGEDGHQEFTKVLTKAPLVNDQAMVTYDSICAWKSNTLELIDVTEPLPIAYPDAGYLERELNRISLG